MLADPRRKLFAAARPQPRVEEWWRGALRATYPSTLGLTVLGAVSLAFSPVLAAVLAGVIGGLGVAGALSAAMVLLDRG